MTQIEMLNIEIEQLQEQLSRPELSFRAKRMIKCRLKKLRRERYIYNANRQEKDGVGRSDAR